MKENEAPEQYISKSALVAEIKKLKAELPKNRGYKRNAYNHVLHIIDSFEVKEVDLEKELNIYLEKVKKTDEDIMFGDFAKHFFELGMQQSKNDSNNGAKSS